MAFHQRSIIRKLSLTPRFHQVDMMGVVHNAEYFRWFEEGRLGIMWDMLPLQEARERGLAFPVTENSCKYLKFAGFGDSLILTTVHRIVTNMRAV